MRPPAYNRYPNSFDADLALALSLNGRDLFRDEQPLKILLMSATLVGERLSGLLDDAPILRSEGRMFPARWALRSSSPCSGQSNTSVRSPRASASLLVDPTNLRLTG